LLLATTRSGEERRGEERRGEERRTSRWDETSTGDESASWSETPGANSGPVREIFRDLCEVGPSPLLAGADPRRIGIFCGPVSPTGAARRAFLS